MPASNREVADIFEAIADMLEIQSESPFRTLSYRHAADAIRESDRPAPKDARRVAGDLMGAVSELQKQMNQVPQKRQEAARKAARTRARNAEKRSSSAKKGARTPTKPKS